MHFLRKRTEEIAPRNILRCNCERHQPRTLSWHQVGRCCCCLPACLPPPPPPPPPSLLLLIDEVSSRAFIEVNDCDRACSVKLEIGWGYSHRLGYIRRGCGLRPLSFGSTAFRIRTEIQSRKLNSQNLERALARRGVSFPFWSNVVAAFQFFFQESQILSDSVRRMLFESEMKFLEVLEL